LPVTFNCTATGNSPPISGEREKMKRQEGFFTGVRKTKIYYQAWLPDGKTRAVLLIVHGGAEHSGRYMNVVNRFVPKGYAVYGFDHSGHGRSEGRRVHVHRFADFCETLGLYVDLVRGWQPDTPIYLIGHSMGGLISSVYLLNHQARLAGVVFSSPAVKLPDSIPLVAIFVANLFSELLPRLGLLSLQAAGTCRDPDVMQAYFDDPLVGYPGKMTARLEGELIKSMQRITAEAGKNTLPLLILQGGADPLVDPAGAQLLYETVSSTDKTIKVYKGLYHEVFNEPEHTQVLDDLETWLAARVFSHTD
jgi:alpha-beta hydrolase superfamily lysophospholipase